MQRAQSAMSSGDVAYRRTGMNGNGLPPGALDSTDRGGGDLTHMATMT
jgi:hypothetical protein